MPNPKRKTSKRKVRIRKAMAGGNMPITQKCSHCGAIKASHRVCPSCGYYRNRQVLTVEAD